MNNCCNRSARSGRSSPTAVANGVKITGRSMNVPTQVSAPPTDLPRNTNFAARTNPKVVNLARFVPHGTAGAATGPQLINATIYSPSSRFKIYIAVAFEPDNTTAPDPAFIDVPTWQIRSIGRNPESGRETPLQLAYPPPLGAVTVMPLPDAYEADSAAKELRVTVNLNSDNLSAAYVPAASAMNVVLYVTWEPNTPMPDAERDYLYGQCSISAQAPLSIDNTAT